jgi:hypothetical protein
MFVDAQWILGREKTLEWCKCDGELFFNVGDNVVGKRLPFWWNTE